MTRRDATRALCNADLQTHRAWDAMRDALLSVIPYLTDCQEIGDDAAGPLLAQTRAAKDLAAAAEPARTYAVRPASVPAEAAVAFAGNGTAGRFTGSEDGGCDDLDR